MAIQKRFIHFKKFSDFNSKKLSANEANTQYTVGISGETQDGEPDILYQSYVWIKDTQNQWTHGQLYDGSIIDLSQYLTADEIAEVYATIDALDSKQDALISGTNIKTINGESILGEGNLTIESGATVYTWNWDGSESGTLTQDEYDGIVGADIVYISLMGGIPTQVNVSKDGGYRMIVFTQFAPQESGSILAVLFITEINEDKSYKSNISYILIPTKTSQLENDSNFVSSDGLKTINGESIVGSGDITISGNSDANIQAVDTGDVIDDVNVEYTTKAYVDGLVGDINSVLESIINSGGSGVKMISFKVGQTQYQAEEGMTWEEFVNSEYNTLEAFISNSYVAYAGGAIALNNTPVNKDDLILAESYGYIT